MLWDPIRIVMLYASLFVRLSYRTWPGGSMPLEHRGTPGPGGLFCSLRYVTSIGRSSLEACGVDVCLCWCLAMQGIKVQVRCFSLGPRVLREVGHEMVAVGGSVLK